MYLDREKEHSSCIHYCLNCHRVVMQFERWEQREQEPIKPHACKGDAFCYCRCLHGNFSSPLTGKECNVFGCVIPPRSLGIWNKNSTLNHSFHWAFSVPPVSFSAPWAKGSQDKHLDLFVCCEYFCLFGWCCRVWSFSVSGYVCIWK